MRDGKRSAFDFTGVLLLASVSGIYYYYYYLSFLLSVV